MSHEPLQSVRKPRYSGVFDLPVENALRGKNCGRIGEVDIIILTPNENVLAFLALNAIEMFA